MTPFFRQSIDQHLFSGSQALLDSQRAHFRENHLSGAIEIQAKAQELDVVVFGGGEETGTYRLWPDSHLKISPSEIGIGWDRKEVPLCSITLPDRASRAIWQALEFQTFSLKEINGRTGWEKFLESCRSEKLTGMVGVASELCDGFVFMQAGLPAPSESIFCSSEGFTDSLEILKGYMDYPQQLTIYKADPSTQAYQTTLLRMGAGGWGKRILSNYKELVGQKLLHILNTSLNAILLNQQSNIHLADIEIIDNHFFFECRRAAETYQALFQDMSKLIGRVIGGTVTRRIMNNTFGQLQLVEQEVLSTNTLAPGTFLN